MTVVYEGYEGRTPRKPDPNIARLVPWRYGKGRGRTWLAAQSGIARRFELALSGSADGSEVWMINEKVYPKTDPLVLGLGDQALVVFRNRSTEAHPMHLHGQSFRVLAVNGSRLAEPIVKDTVDVEPKPGSVAMEFVASNPGTWFFHCHKPTHMEGGMITLAKIVR